MGTKNQYHSLVYTVKEACKVLKISDTHFYREIKKGTIPHIRIGTKILISKARLEEWLKEGG